MDKILGIEDTGVRIHSSKRRYTYTPNDSFRAYWKKYRGINPVGLSKQQWKNITWTVIELYKDALIIDKQIIRPIPAIGKLQVVKRKVKKKDTTFYSEDLTLMTDNWFFQVYWFKSKRSQFKHAGIYSFKLTRTTARKIFKHVIDLATDPYKKDYNTPLMPGTKI